MPSPRQRLGVIFVFGARVSTTRVIPVRASRADIIGEDASPNGEMRRDPDSY